MINDAGVMKNTMDEYERTRFFSHVIILLSHSSSIPGHKTLHHRSSDPCHTGHIFFWDGTETIVM